VTAFLPAPPVAPPPVSPTQAADIRLRTQRLRDQRERAAELASRVRNQPQTPAPVTVAPHPLSPTQAADAHHEHDTPPVADGAEHHHDSQPPPAVAPGAEHHHDSEPHVRSKNKRTSTPRTKRKPWWRRAAERAAPPLLGACGLYASDARTGRFEYGKYSSCSHTVLDVGGLVPGGGEPIDGVNAAWYAAEGDGTNAALSAGSMFPFLGWGSTIAKWGKKAEETREAAEAARKAEAAREAAEAASKAEAAREAAEAARRAPAPAARRAAPPAARRAAPPAARRAAPAPPAMKAAPAPPKAVRKAEAEAARKATAMRNQANKSGSRGGPSSDDDWWTEWPREGLRINMRTGERQVVRDPISSTAQRNAANNYNGWVGEAKVGAKITSGAVIPELGSKAKLVGSPFRVALPGAERVIDHLVELPSGELVALEVKTGRGRDVVQRAKDDIMGRIGGFIDVDGILEWTGPIRTVEVRP